MLTAMKAVAFSDYGGPEVLEVRDVPETHAGPGQVRIAVRAAGVNPIDWKVRSGALRQAMQLTFPAIDGREAAGVVDEVGDGVTDVAVGEAVFGLTTGGGAAEHAVLEGWARKPTELSFEQAAALPVAADTTGRMIAAVGGVRGGETVVVDGAGGGVGAIAVQVLRARGARVIGTAGPGNQEFLRELGAEPTTYGDGLADRLRALAPEGIDRGFDVAGRGGAAVLAELTGDPGRVVTIADFAAAQRGVQVTTAAQGRAQGALEEAAALAAGGRLHVEIAAVHPFAGAAEAHRASEGGHVRGKLVLVPGP
jgi:NADPH:quinone reductase-like Zn-dependent oxidoreductase